MEGPNTTPSTELTQDLLEIETIKANVIVSPSSKSQPSIIQTNLKSNPVATTPTPTPTPSTSKVFIITPDQIAKLGLTQQLNKVVESQIKPVNKTPSECQEKKSVRISKITIINSSASENGKAVSTKTESVRSESLIKTAGAKNEVGTGMKSRLVSLLKSHKTPTTTTVITNIPPTETQSLNRQVKESFDLTKKRKLDRLEESSQKVAKTTEDDVIVLDADVPAEKVSKPKFTILNLTRPIVTPVTPTSVIQSVGNTINVEEQPKIIKKNVIPVTPVTLCEDMKQKIQVLSNQQISLSSDYIKLLKGRLPENKQQNKPPPTILNYQVAESSKIKNVEMDDPIIIEDDTEKPETASSSDVRSNKDPTVENLERQFVNKDMILLINDTEFNFTEPDNEASSATGNQQNISESTKVSISDKKLQVIDLTEENKTSNATKHRTPNILQTRIVSIEKPDEEKKNSKTSIKPPEVIDISGDDSLKPIIIQSFSEKIKNKLTSNYLRASLNPENMLSTSNIIRTYSKKDNLLLNSSIGSSKPKSITPTIVSIIKPSGEQQKSPEKPVKRTYKKRKSLLIDLSKTQDKEIDNKRKSVIKKTKVKNSKNNSDTDMESIIIDDNDDSETNDQTIEQNETPKSTPKKRGRKKKSDLLKIQEEFDAQKKLNPETEPETEPALELSKRGRKRKVINYCALAEGNEIDDIYSFVKKQTLSESESAHDADDSIVYSESEEQTPKPKRRGRPKKIRIEDGDEKVEDSEAFTDGKSKILPESKNDCDVQDSELEEEVVKPRRRGRPKKIRIEDTSTNEDRGEKTEDSEAFTDGETKTLPKSEYACGVKGSESEEEVGKPRKRGKPNKLKIEETALTDEDKNETKNTEVLNDDVNKKSKTVSDSEHKHSETEDKMSVPEEQTRKPRKRGRPRKMTIEDTSTADSKDENKDLGNETKTSETSDSQNKDPENLDKTSPIKGVNSVPEEQKQKPKRRGRPRKMTIEDTSTTDNKDETKQSEDKIPDIIPLNESKNSEICTSTTLEEQSSKPRKITTDDRSTNKDKVKNSASLTDDENKKSESERTHEKDSSQSVETKLKNCVKSRKTTINNTSTSEDQDEEKQSETHPDNDNKNLENENSGTLDDNQDKHQEALNEPLPTNVDNEDETLPSQESTEEVKPKRGRGRPRINKHSNSILALMSYINTSAEQKMIKQEDATIQIKTECSGDPDASLDETGVENSANSSLVIQKRGRKGRKKSSESKEGTLASNITCAVCNKQMAKTGWLAHKLRFHNNLAWRIGDTPLDLQDERLVISILSDIYKKKKPLYCELCSTTKKSVVGFLSHKAVCQKSTEEVTAMRIKCEHCDKSMMPVSLTMHLKFCKKGNFNNTDIEDSFTATNDLVVEGKRKAATKAKDLIKSFNEDDVVEKKKVKKPRYSRMWIKNYDFQPSFFGKRRFGCEINRDGAIKCRFEECEFTSSDVDEFVNHLRECDNKPKEGYTCKYCIITYKTEEEVLEHLKKLHSNTNTKEFSDNEQVEDDDDDDDEDDGDCEDNKQLVKNKIPVNKPTILHGIKFLLKNRLCAPSTNIIYPPALEWMIKFCKENYSDKNLFPNWRITLKNWETLNPLYLSNYLPQLKYSACTAEIHNTSFVDPLQLEHEWKRYKLFESHLSNNDTATFFCGGPIFAMTWLPTPYDQKHCDQILAVSANSHVNREYTLDEVYSESGLIQFWNCGTLANNISMINPPKLEFCIAHDHGPIWCLEWCPSGCYDMQQSDDFLQRLGILAVGAQDSCVYLYSVCFPTEKRDKIVIPQPVAKLMLESKAENTTNDLEAQVTRISWSKASQHRYLLAGYANGLVAIFDLDTTSSLLKWKDDGIDMIMPYRTISAHDHAITALSLYHLNDGRRWIMTGSIDRTIKYWDLENPAAPLTNFVKIIVTDGVWLNYWLSNMICFDDSCSGGLTASITHQLRSYESSPTTTMYSSSCVLSVTGSEWLNGFIQSNVVGEIKGFFPHQMFCAMDSDKTYKNKRAILGYSRLIPKALTIPERLENEKQILEKLNKKSQQIFDAEQVTDIQNTLLDCLQPEPSTYAEAEKKYGLVFCDISLDQVKNFITTTENYYESNKSNKLYVTRPEVYPLQAVNKVVLNPNRSSFAYLAAGYQAGFVRISRLDFLDKRYV